MNKRVPSTERVLPVFTERWSPRSFSQRPPEPTKLRSMFEAARLAPSAHNTQPSRFLLTRRDHGEDYARLFACLSDGNRAWAHTAPVLVLAAAMRTRPSAVDGSPVAYPHFMHDLGLAVMSLILQGQALGLFCHPMAGFDPDRAREEFAVPSPFEPGVVIAVGYLGSPDALPEALRAREVGPRTRRPVEEVVFEGGWGQPSALFTEPVAPSPEPRP